MTEQNMHNRGVGLIGLVITLAIVGITAVWYIETYVGPSTQPGRTGVYQVDTIYDGPIQDARKAHDTVENRYK